MKLTKTEIAKEVDTALTLCQDIITDAADMDVDDIQHHAEQIKKALMRVRKDVL